jgi:hypothetical protein
MRMRPVRIDRNALCMGNQREAQHC